MRGIQQLPAVSVLLGPVVIGTTLFDQSFAQPGDYGVAVDTAGGATPAAKRSLGGLLAGFPNAKVQTVDAFIKSQQAAINTLLNLFYLLLALAIVVSLFGIVNTLVLSIVERTREIGALRAMGMTRRQLTRMIRIESQITAMIGASLGIVVGLALAALATVALSTLEPQLHGSREGPSPMLASSPCSPASPPACSRRAEPPTSTRSKRSTTNRPALGEPTLPTLLAPGGGRSGIQTGSPGARGEGHRRGGARQSRCRFGQSQSVGLGPPSRTVLLTAVDGTSTGRREALTDAGSRRGQARTALSRRRHNERGLTSKPNPALWRSPSGCGVTDFRLRRFSARIAAGLERERLVVCGLGAGQVFLEHVVDPVKVHEVELRLRLPEAGRDAVLLRAGELVVLVAAAQQHGSLRGELCGQVGGIVVVDL